MSPNHLFPWRSNFIHLSVGLSQLGPETMLYTLKKFTLLYVEKKKIRGLVFSRIFFSVLRRRIRFWTNPASCCRSIIKRFDFRAKLSKPISTHDGPILRDHCYYSQKNFDETVCSPLVYKGFYESRTIMELRFNDFLFTLYRYSASLSASCSSYNSWDQRSHNRRRKKTIIFNYVTQSSRENFF